MITRGDVQRVIDAFILEETLCWWLHPFEQVQTVRGNDGYHWALARQMVQHGEWMSLKAYMDTMGETYLRESIEHLVQSASPRLYHEVLDGMPGKRRRRPSTKRSDFVKTGVGS